MLSIAEFGMIVTEIMQSENASASGSSGQGSGDVEMRSQNTPHVAQRKIVSSGVHKSEKTDLQSQWEAS